MTAQTAGLIHGDFPARVKELRVSLLLTQERFAALVGVTPPLVSNWELGKHPPSMSSLGKIVKATGCSPAWLRGLPNNDMSPGPTHAARMIKEQK
jgi:transcriptional regulator with XRE-family HTH domain